MGFIFSLDEFSSLVNAFLSYISKLPLDEVDKLEFSITNGHSDNTPTEIVVLISKCQQLNSQTDFRYLLYTIIKQYAKENDLSLDMLNKSANMIRRVLYRVISDSKVIAGLRFHLSAFYSVMCAESKAHIDSHSSVLNTLDEFSRPLTLNALEGLIDYIKAYPDIDFRPHLSYFVEEYRRSRVEAFEPIAASCGSVYVDVWDDWRVILANETGIDLS